MSHYKIKHTPVKPEDFSLIKTLLKTDRTNKWIAEAAGRSVGTVVLMRRFDTYEEYRAFTNETSKRKIERAAARKQVEEAMQQAVKMSESKVEMPVRYSEDTPAIQTIRVEGLDELTQAVRDLAKAWESKPMQFDEEGNLKVTADKKKGWL